MLIAFDTSTAIASLALYAETGLIAEATWQSHRNQTAHLLPMAQKLLDLEKVTPDKLSGVAVALGPGSFNGLRVGVSAAKGIALALGIPILGFSSLDIVACQHSYLSGSLCAIIEAGRGRLGVGFYRVKGGNWKQVGEYLNLTVPELIERTTQTTLFCGELSNEQRHQLTEGLGKNAIILPPAAMLRRAGTLAEMAWQRLETGDLGDDLTNLQPIYLHQPVSK
ncbi:MAG: tRNA (adenosine(37)-N6)-threonylcarbamoyltransferase complex dimerization subunit type 1 TsaB [Chloroflexota bacterium]|nr:tRNA (adenosine(37)-N6)-threonylcarbamoyltransferase complex dimerization subunit type 1 TsaB [Chloroflexota bacterium]